MHEKVEHLRPFSKISHCGKHLWRNLDRKHMIWYQRLFWRIVCLDEKYFFLPQMKCTFAVRFYLIYDVMILQSFKLSKLGYELLCEVLQKGSVHLCRLASYKTLFHVWRKWNMKSFIGQYYLDFVLCEFYQTAPLCAFLCVHLVTKNRPHPSQTIFTLLVWNKSCKEKSW